MRKLLIIGAIGMALSVMLGAFGAHALKDILSERMLANWQTGVHYQMVHALGILFLGLLYAKADLKLFRQAAWLMAVGIIFFSGSLYIMALTGITLLGAITPIGGVLFILGWIFVIRGAFKV
ncbi:MAG: hypothetical protein RLZZ267_472 [Bacillota bacterium]|jgi:uncharacterized membrane protein YgdD (TMEM256/DUF423 family)